MTDSTANVGISVETLAREKMSRVLGASRAQKLFAEIMAEIGLAQLSTPENLLVFSRALSRRPAFEGTVGTMLVVAAVLRGARDVSQ